MGTLHLVKGSPQAEKPGFCLGADAHIYRAIVKGETAIKLVTQFVISTMAIPRPWAVDGKAWQL